MATLTSLRIVNTRQVIDKSVSDMKVIATGK